eukprot:CAMPEP_0184869312 /NCGR_PEP_ID=MMETSP0580-20130426/33618_1 /TAXON_ID=1118495 /ORGANISM="Dactyliosolen fragilissimus" /LENGTH=118 /DNA_ID=CAMNT_0027370713 /DNA_START=241 /DNA_END=597 /DNA_ORIENTATION=+
MERRSLLGSIITTILVTPSETLASETLDFSLPSYDEASKNKIIDPDIESVNKAIMQKAKKDREIVQNTEKEKETRALRKAEKEVSTDLEALLAQAEIERKAKIEKEKEEARANRMNTF